MQENDLTMLHLKKKKITLEALWFLNNHQFISSLV